MGMAWVVLVDIQVWECLGFKTMNSKITTINIVYSLTILGLALAQPALAKEGGARFTFAPTVYKLEEAPEIPKGSPAHIVKNGNVPHDTNFLGLNPTMLAKRPAPVVVPTPQVAPTQDATPALTQNNVQGTLSKTPVSPMFGTPGVLKVAQAHVPTGASAIAKAIPSTHASKSHSGLNADKSVHGVITSHHHKPVASPNGLVAKSGGGLDSYGKDFGYVPGSYTPSTSSGGMSTDTNVTGRLIRR